MGGRGELTHQIISRKEPEFEYDPAKSASNKDKHGIDFEKAKALWNDSARIQYPSRYEKEARNVTIARLDSQHYVAITTTRGDRTRIISVRRARKEEVTLYEKANVS